MIHHVLSRLYGDLDVVIVVIRLLPAPLYPLDDATKGCGKEREEKFKWLTIQYEAHGEFRKISMTKPVGKLRTTTIYSQVDVLHNLNVKTSLLSNTRIPNYLDWTPE